MAGGDPRHGQPGEAQGDPQVSAEGSGVNEEWPFRCVASWRERKVWAGKVWAKQSPTAEFFVLSHSLYSGERPIISHTRPVASGLRCV